MSGIVDLMSVTGLARQWAQKGASGLEPGPQVGKNEAMCAFLLVLVLPGIAREPSTCAGESRRVLYNIPCMRYHSTPLDTMCCRLLWSLSPEGTWDPPVIGPHGAWSSMTTWLGLVPVPLSLRELRWCRVPQATFGEAAREQTGMVFPSRGDERPGQALAELWALKQPPTGVLVCQTTTALRSTRYRPHLTPP
jgi:hypothetical protein